MENLSKIIEGILFVAGEPVSFLDISEKLEIEKEGLTSKMQEQLDYQELEKLGKRMNEITDLIDEKELRWLELDEIGN